MMVLLQIGSKGLPAIGLHGYSGCDTASAFVRKGEVKPFKLMQKQPEFLQIFEGVGRGPEMKKSSGCSLAEGDDIMSVNLRGVPNFVRLLLPMNPLLVCRQPVLHTSTTTLSENIGLQKFPQG